MEDVFRPLGMVVGLDGELAGPRKPLTDGKISSTSATAAGLLSGLAGWFNKADDRSIAKRIIQKAYQEAKRETDILDLHFTLQAMIGTCYRDRDNDPAALGAAIQACQEQIQIAPQAAGAFKNGDFPDGLPFHVGYDQLRVIYKKQGDYAKALALCEHAREQGWGGDWNKKIDELTRLANRKMSKGR